MRKFVPSISIVSAVLAFTGPTMVSATPVAVPLDASHWTGRGKVAFEVREGFPPRHHDDLRR